MGEFGFQGVENLLFVDRGLLEGIELGFACGVGLIVGFGVDVVLLEREFALSQIRGFLRFSDFRFKAGEGSGSLSFFVGVG